MGRGGGSKQEPTKKRTAPPSTHQLVTKVIKFLLLLLVPSTALSPALPGLGRIHHPFDQGPQQLLENARVPLPHARASPVPSPPASRLGQLVPKGEGVLGDGRLGVGGDEEEEAEEGLLLVGLRREEEGEVGERHLDEDHADAFGRVRVPVGGGAGGGREGGRAEGGEVGGL